MPIVPSENATAGSWGLRKFHSFLPNRPGPLAVRGPSLGAGCPWRLRIFGLGLAIQKCEMRSLFREPAVSANEVVISVATPNGGETVRSSTGAVRGSSRGVPRSAPILAVPSLARSRQGRTRHRLGNLAGRPQADPPLPCAWSWQTSPSHVSPIWQDSGALPAAAAVMSCWCAWAGGTNFPLQPRRLPGRG